MGQSMEWRVLKGTKHCPCNKIHSVHKLQRLNGLRFMHEMEPIMYVSVCVHISHLIAASSKHYRKPGVKGIKCSQFKLVIIGRVLIFLMDILNIQPQICTLNHQQHHCLQRKMRYIQQHFDTSLVCIRAYNWSV